MSRFFVVFLLLFAALGQVQVCAGAQKETGAAAGPVTISYMIREVMGRYPTNVADSIPMSELEKRLNIKWDLIPVADKDYNDKFSVTLASGDLPDLISINGGVETVNRYAPEGYFLDYKPHLAKMPNLARWVNQIPNLKKNITTDDGKIYYIALFKTSITDNFSWSFGYRKDVFDKHGLKIGRTFEDLYQNLKALKALYTKSYPLINPDGMALVSEWAYFFETGSDVFCDQWGERQRYVYGPTTENYRKMLQFFNRLYAEGLLYPEFHRTSKADYEKLIVTNVGFVGANNSIYQHVNTTNAGKKENNNPDFVWAITHFPSFDGKPGRVASWQAADRNGRVIGAKTKVMDTIARVIDYMCTDEYVTIQQYGLRGMTYEAGPDGKPRYMAHIKTTQDKWKYGLQDDFTNIVIVPPGLFEANVDPEVAKMLAFYDEDKAGLPDPPYLYFTESENDELKQLTALNTYKLESTLKFITGQMSFDAWDAYVKRCIELGAQKKTDIHNNSYDRYLKRPAD